jgi:hypothetical protein
MQTIRLVQNEWSFDENARLGPPGGFGEVFRGSGAKGPVAVRVSRQVQQRFVSSKLAKFLEGAISIMSFRSSIGGSTRLAIDTFSSCLSVSEACRTRFQRRPHLYFQSA